MSDRVRPTNKQDPRNGGISLLMIRRSQGTHSPKRRMAGWLASKKKKAELQFTAYEFGRKKVKVLFFDHDDDEDGDENQEEALMRHETP